MRGIRSLFFLAIAACWLIAPTAQAQSNPNCKRIVTYPSTCTVGSCNMTINVRVCQNLTTATFQCDSCNSTKICCGADVCNASYIGSCQGPNPNAVAALARLPKARSARMLLPNCDGSYSSYRSGL
jgi:hypothetical protein